MALDNAAANGQTEAGTVAAIFGSDKGLENRRQDFRLNACPVIEYLDFDLLEVFEQVEIQVLDDGAGIQAEILPTIFEPFVTTKDRSHGTGLGLAVSRSIIERHSGKISIQSEVGKGTTVKITLPLTAGISLPSLAGAGAY